jgi:hypothetical protein
MKRGARKKSGGRRGKTRKAQSKRIARRAPVRAPRTRRAPKKSRQPKPARKRAAARERGAVKKPGRPKPTVRKSAVKKPVEKPAPAKSVRPALRPSPTEAPVKGPVAATPVAASPTAASTPTAAPAHAPAMSARYGGVSDAAVQARTGRTWSEWIAALDRAGAHAMNHTEIATHLHDKENVPDWWAQMVAVGYEQAKGLRRPHETAEGFQVTASRTIAVPIAELFAAWSEEATRATWLGRPAMTISKMTPPKSIRIRWNDDSRVVVMFTARGDRRSQVAVDHSRLANAQDVPRLKAYWGAALDRLRVKLEA